MFIPTNIKNKSKIILTFSLLLVLLVPTTFAGPPSPPPVGVSGTILLDGTPLTNHSVTFIDTNTSENHSLTTNEQGRYAVVFSNTKTGHIVEVSTEYDGKTFNNQTHINISLTTNWLNLSIESTPNNDDDEGDDDDTPSPPQSYSPVADFFYAPTSPTVDDSVIFSSLSYDEDNDIVSTIWEINHEIKTGESVSYTFTSSGEYDITQLVEDSQENTDSITKTVSISATETDSDDGETNGTDETDENGTDENGTTDDDDNNTDFTNTTDNTTENNNFTANITVYDTNNKPLENAKVKISSTNYSATHYTDSDGTVHVNLPEGDYTVSAYKEDDVIEEQVSLDSNKDVYLSFTGDAPLKKTEGFNWWFVIIIVAIIIAVIGVFMWYKGQKSWF